MESFDWSGCAAVCIASGPSLAEEDCQQVGAAGLPTVVVNTSWKLAPFAQVMFAGDQVWWEHYGAEVTIPAQRWTVSQRAAELHGARHFRVRGTRSSGCRAIELAIELGAKRVLLLGYDCSVDSGAHWHGLHQRTGNPDAARCAGWRREFAQLAAEAAQKGVQIINCSRVTALSCFPRMALQEALCLFKA